MIQRSLLLLFLLFPQLSISQEDTSNNRLSNFREMFKFEDKDSLFSFPIYRIRYTQEKGFFKEMEEGNFVKYYKGDVYFFYDNEKAMLFGTDPIVHILSDLIKKKKEFIIAYVEDTFSLDRKNLFPIITNRQLGNVIEGDKTFSSLHEYIRYRYGSIEKYREILDVEKERNALEDHDFIEIVKNNYKIYEAKCPNDTTLIVNTFLKQIKYATKDLTPQQEMLLHNQIMYKIKVSDKIRSYLTSKYDFILLGKSITSELLEVLTKDQFVKYKKYTDIVSPIEKSKIRNIGLNRTDYVYIVYKSKKKENEYRDYIKKILYSCEDKR